MSTGDLTSYRAQRHVSEAWPRGYRNFRTKPFSHSTVVRHRPPVRSGGRPDRTGGLRHVVEEHVHRHV